VIGSSGWFAAPLSVFSLSIRQSNHRDFHFFHWVIAPVEDRVLPKNQHLYLPAGFVPLSEIASTMWLAAESAEKPKEFVALLRTTLALELENLPPKINLILHRF
jgi:hypothetical protein